MKVNKTAREIYKFLFRLDEDVLDRMLSLKFDAMFPSEVLARIEVLVRECHLDITQEALEDSRERGW
jgi:hypothetical protein